MGECKRYAHGQVFAAHPPRHWSSAGLAQTATGAAFDSKTAQRQHSEQHREKHTTDQPT